MNKSDGHFCLDCGEAIDEDDLGYCEACRDERHYRQRDREEHTDPDYGGVLGADGQIHSDADPGL